METIRVGISLLVILYALTIPASLAALQCADSLPLLEVGAGCFVPEGRHFSGGVVVSGGTLEVRDNAELLAKNLTVGSAGAVDVKEKGAVCIGEGCESALDEAYIEKFFPSFLSPLNNKLYSNQSRFEVFWKSKGAALSFQVQYMTTEVPGVWKDWLTTAQGSAHFGPSSPVAVKEGMEYSFRVKVTKADSSVSDWSQPKSITLDMTGPTCSVHGESEYAGKEFSMTFVTSDAGAGVSSVELEYMENSTWKDAGAICTISRERASCATPENITSISFRCRARDYANNLGQFSGPVTFSVDTDLPSVAMEARDQSGRLLEKSEPSADIDSVTITSKAVDKTSGIRNHTIVVIITAGGKMTTKVKGCGAADPEEESSCSFSVEIQQGAQVKYRAEAYDRAGNFMATEWWYIFSNPIANFIADEVVLAIGSYFENGVQVRNLGEKSATVELALKEYPLARFVVSGDVNAELGQDGRTLVVKNLLPQEERVFEVEMLSAEAGSYMLELEANVRETGAKDGDSVRIVVDFPASFSALAGFYPALLMLLAAAAYLLLRKNVSI